MTALDITLAAVALLALTALVIVQGAANDVTAENLRLKNLVRRLNADLGDARADRGGVVLPFRRGDAS